MARKIVSATVAATLLLSAVLPSQASAQLAVVDAGNIANTAAQLTELKNHLTQLKATYDKVTDQLSEAKRMTAAVTGSRGLGDILNDPSIRKYLPTSMKNIYDAASRGGYAGISGTIDEVLKAEELTGSTADKIAAIQARRQRGAATNKLVGEDGFAGAQARLAQLDALQKKINDTEDPKAIQDLQARIMIEQANMAAEAQKLQLMSMMAAAEEKLAEQQARELSGRILSSSSKGMGKIR
jgi:type IV secretion system protein VirB5